MTDTLISNARIVRPSGTVTGGIAIEDGLIIAVGPDVTDDHADADETVDAEGMVALPGVVDIHNHMHDDELFPEGIDFASETASAVAGGVTTVVELPTQTPVTDTESFQKKRADCEELAHVDFGLVAGNVEDSDVDVESVITEGTRDFKTFTAEPYLADDRTIVELMDAVGEAGGKVRVHCETQGILDHARAQIDGDDPEVYMDSRPLAAEMDAISRMGRFAEYADCPLHVVHVSSGSGAREGARFVSRANVPVTLETCPHYLAFSEEDVAEKGPFLKVNPSLKSPEEVERLWDAVQDGTIDLVASEHFPTYRENREQGWEDIWEPYAGLPSIETMLEFLVSEGVHTDRLSWTRLHELVCARPAKEAGIYPQKGSLDVGTDADIVLLSDERYTVAADDLAYVGGWTPYEGREWTARVDTVFVGGEMAASGHEVYSEAGDGAFLHREPMP
jgi:dihydropyrimidinase/dihydroorotase